MDVIGRRTALRSLLCGVVAVGLGAGLVANPVEAMPLAMQKDGKHGRVISRKKLRSW